MKLKTLSMILFQCIASLCSIAQVTENRTVENFNAIDVTSGIPVEFTQTDKFFVKVVANNQEVLNAIITKVENGTLKVYVVNESMKLDIKKYEIYISAPHLNRIKVNGGCKFSTKNTLKEKNLSVEIESGVTFTADIITENLTFKANSGCHPVLTGKSEKANFEISIGVNCKAEGFIAKQVIATVNTSSSLRINVIETLEAFISDHSSVYYKGNPSISKKVHLNSSINKI